MRDHRLTAQSTPPRPGGTGGRAQGSGAARRRSRARPPGEHGGQLVEFGLLVLPLLTILLGIVEGSRYLFTYNQLNDAVRAGAAYAVRAETLSTPNDSNVRREALRAIVAIPGPITLTTTTGTHSTTGDAYVEVSASTVFTPVVSLVPFRGTLQAHTRAFKP